MKFVLAVLYVCMSNGQCEQKTIRIAGCHNESHAAQVPMNGEWKDAKVGVRCQDG